MAERKGLILYHSHIKSLEKMPDDLRGILLLALLRYSDTGEAQGVPESLEYIFDFMCSEADRDKEKFKETCSARAEAGKRGGLAKQANARGTKQSKAKQANASIAKDGKQGKQNIANQANADADADAEADGIPPLPPTGGNPPDLLQRRFDELWDAYPKKVGKGAALTALKKLKLNQQLFDQIMAAVHVAKKNAWFMRDKGQYIPNLSTWLNQTRWEDELPEGDTDDGRTDQTDPGSYSEDDIPF